MKKEIDLNDMLEEQERIRNTATLESIPNEPERVKITPWIEGLGCSCASAIVVSRSAIKRILKTEDIHICCGKRLYVCEVEFDDDATISVSEIFKQSTANVFDAASSDSANFGMAVDVQGMSGLSSQTVPFEAPWQSGVEYEGGDSDLLSIDPYQDHQDSLGGATNAPVSYAAVAGINCPPGTVIVPCNGRHNCAKPGSHCCGGRICPPGYSCIPCGGRLNCVRQGSHCCGARGQICPPGTRCVPRGGQLVCVR